MGGSVGSCLSNPAMKEESSLNEAEIVVQDDIGVGTHDFNHDCISSSGLNPLTPSREVVPRS